MSESVELKFPTVAHNRLICDAARRDEAAMKAEFAGFELVGRLERFAAVCEGHKTVSEVFVKDLRARAAKLAKTMRNPFFASVGRFAGLRLEGMVLQRRQGYADIYATWLMLKRTLDWIKKKRLYNMPLDKAEEIGIADEASAKAKSMLFLVSGAQGHKEKPSVFRIKRGSATKVTQADLVSKYGYIPRKSEPGKGILAMGVGR